MHLYLIYGPPRSGKSLLAEQLASSFSANVVYVATLPNLMFHQPRITRHVARRPATWTTMELTGHWKLDKQLLDQISGSVVLLDGLQTLMLRLMLTASPDDNIDMIIARLASLLLRLVTKNRETLIVTAPLNDDIFEAGKTIEQLLNILRTHATYWIEVIGQ